MSRRFSQSRDPYWTVARFKSACSSSQCGCIIPTGAKIYYFPNTRSVFCDKCGAREQSAFISAAQDEYFYNHQ